LQELYDIARKKLKFVFLGNLRTGMGQNTYCPVCNTMVIGRSGYFTEITGLDHLGRCLQCNTEVIKKEYMASF
jgi:pyruvate formate lyase activating enzyme